MWLQSIFNPLLTCVQQLGTLLLTLLQTLSEGVDDSGSLQLLFFSLAL